MALLIESGDESKTESEMADMNAISALNENAAIELEALYGAVRASLSLNLLAEAKSYCEQGVAPSPDNDNFKKLARQIDLLSSECEKRDTEISKDIAAAKMFVSAIEDRGLKVGKTMYQALTGLNKRQY